MYTIYRSNMYIYIYDNYILILPGTLEPHLYTSQLRCQCALSRDSKYRWTNGLQFHYQRSLVGSGWTTGWALSWGAIDESEMSSYICGSLYVYVYVCIYIYM